MHPEPEPAAAAEAAPPAEKKRKVKKLALLFLLILILVAGGGLAYLMFADDPGLEGGPAQAARPHDRAILSLEPFLVNLADREARRYLKVKVELEVDREKSVKELEKSLSPIRDALIMLLSSKAYADICTVEGKRRLKQDILKKLAAIPGGQAVRTVYFTEFVAQ